MPYLIDGDNVLWAWEFEGNIEEGRSQLLRIISKYQKNKRSKFIVFFDGPTKEKIIENEELRIVISGSGESADELIREMLETQIDCRNFILVSSDRELRYQAKIRRAKIITSPQFIKILNRQIGKSKKEERNNVLSSLEVKLWENIFKRKDNETKKTLKIPFRRKG